MKHIIATIMLFIAKAVLSARRVYVIGPLVAVRCANPSQARARPARHDYEYQRNGRLAARQVY
jgi:hypothetical protein